MANSVTYSTFVLTLLLMVGLVFFIKASTKDRIETFETLLPQSPDVARSALQQYFQQRSYQIVDGPASANRLEFQGWVRPSWFLAVFLSLLAAIGALCFALVLASLWPTYGYGFLALLALSPLAGRFYWTRAGREEMVTLSIVPTPSQGLADQSQITVTAHRDELAILKQALTRSPD